MSLKDLGKYVFGGFLAVALLAWVFRDIEARELWDQLQRASWPGLMLCAAFNASHIAFRSWRWRALLHPLRPGMPFRPMFTAICVGYMTTWVIPGRLGELVRPMILSAEEDLALGPSIGTVVADRLLDAATVVVLFVVGSWFTPLSGRAAEYAGLLRGGSLLMASAAIGVLIAMLLLSGSAVAMRRWLSGRSRPVRWIGRTLVVLSEGARALRSPPLLLRVTVHGLLAWLAIATGTWWGVRAAGAEVSFGTVLVILPMLVLGVAIPTPGGAGSYHALMKQSLLLFGITEVTAVGAGLLVHAAITAPMLLLGAVLLWTERISWRRLVAAARQVRDLGEGGARAGSNSALEGLP